MVLKGQIQEAIALINSLHPELLDTNRYLYFHLQVKQINYSFDDSNCVDHLFNTHLQTLFQLIASEKISM